MEERLRRSVFAKETIQRGVLKGSEASMVGGWCLIFENLWKILAKESRFSHSAFSSEVGGYQNDVKVSSEY